MTDHKSKPTLFGLPRMAPPNAQDEYLALLANQRQVPDEWHAQDTVRYGEAGRELPFPLYPYPACGDVHTPSREVNRDPDAVTQPSPYLPKPRPLTPEERVIVRELVRRQAPTARPGMEPSTLAKAAAAVIVCWLIYIGLGVLLLAH